MTLTQSFLELQVNVGQKLDFLFSLLSFFLSPFIESTDFVIQEATAMCNVKHL